MAYGKIRSTVRRLVLFTNFFSEYFSFNLYGCVVQNNGTAGRKAADVNKDDGKPRIEP